MALTVKEIFKIAAEADCDPRTVERYARADFVQRRIAERIEAACKKLRIKIRA
jgi:hypothetical protein